MKNSETIWCIVRKFCANVVKIKVHLCLSLVEIFTRVQKLCF